MSLLCPWTHTAGSVTVSQTGSCHGRSGKSSTALWVWTETELERTRSEERQQLAVQGAFSRHISLEGDIRASFTDEQAWAQQGR